MLKYFPIHSAQFDLKMDVRVTNSPIIEVDSALYASEIQLRKRIVSSDPAYYHVCGSEAESAAWEAVDYILNDMASNKPAHFQIEESGDTRRWTNGLLGEEIVFAFGDTSTLPRALSPLDWLGTQVQEDLILMIPDSDGQMACAGGHLCFAAGWCLEDKIGKYVLAVHEDVPLFTDRIAGSVDLLMRRLKATRSVERCNWTISQTGDMNRAPKFRDQWLKAGLEITAENAGDRCFFRVERQTLNRLPKSGSILFTIHTYINTIAEVMSDPERSALLAGSILTMPQATQTYKGMTLYYDALCKYLAAQKMGNSYW